MFASTYFDFTPDMLLKAKGLTSGYIPMGGVLVAPRVGALLREAERTQFAPQYDVIQPRGYVRCRFEASRDPRWGGAPPPATRLATTLDAALANVADSPGIIAVRSSELIGGIEVDPTLPWHAVLDAALDQV